MTELNERQARAEEKRKRKAAKRLREMESGKKGN